MTIKEIFYDVEVRKLVGSKNQKDHLRSVLAILMGFVFWLNGGLALANNGLSETTPPAIITQLATAANSTPQVTILSPRPDEVVNSTTVPIRLQVQGIPIFKNTVLGLGPHLHVLVDRTPAPAIYDLSQPINLTNLPPGTHTLQVLAAKPWHESWKNPGALAQVTFHVFAKSPTPTSNLPLLIYNQPGNTTGTEPFLLDFFLTQTPSHQDTQQRSVSDWHVRITINNQSFEVDRWQPFYLKGLQPGANIIKLEYLNAQDQTLDTALRVVNYQPGGTDGLSRLLRNEIPLTTAISLFDPQSQLAIVSDPVPPPVKPVADLPPTQPAPAILPPEPLPGARPTLPAPPESPVIAIPTPPVPIATPLAVIPTPPVPMAPPLTVIPTPPVPIASPLAVIPTPPVPIASPLAVIPTPPVPTASPLPPTPSLNSVLTHPVIPDLPSAQPSEPITDLNSSILVEPSPQSLPNTAVDRSITPSQLTPQPFVPTAQPTPPVPLELPLPIPTPTPPAISVRPPQPILEIPSTPPAPYQYPSSSSNERSVLPTAPTVSRSLPPGEEVIEFKVLIKELFHTTSVRIRQWTNSIPPLVAKWSQAIGHWIGERAQAMHSSNEPT